MSDQTSDKTPLEQLREHLDDAPAAASWYRAGALLSTCFAGDPAAWEAQRGWVIKGLKKHYKQRVWPREWLYDVEAHAHLISMMNRLDLYPMSGELAQAELCALFGLDLSSIRRIDIQYTQLARETFAALWANPTLTQLKELRLCSTGMCDAWLADLLAADALWTGLHTLYLEESKLKADGAALLAASARMRQLTVLSLTGSAIGPAGRKALGASPHLSDKNKDRNKAVATISNEDAEAAPPSPSGAFGDARSLVQRVDEAGWERLCDLLDRLHHSPQQDQLAQELLPYLDGALSRWPDALRMAPLAWLDALLDGKPAPAAISLARHVRIEGIAFSVPRAKALAASEQLGTLRGLHVRGVRLSGSALRALWPRCAELETLELRCHDVGDELLDPLLDRAAPTGLTDLSIRQSATLPGLRAVIARQPNLRRLRLSGRPPHATEPAWVALLDVIADGPVRELELGSGAAPLLEDTQRRPVMLERLLLANAPDDHDRADLLGRWLEGCDRLTSLELGPGWITSAASLEAAMPEGASPALRDLTMDISARATDDDSAARWAAAHIPRLRSLSIDHNNQWGLGQPGAAGLQRALLVQALVSGERLESLHAALGSEATDAAPLERIVAGASLPALTQLSLGTTHRSGEALRILAALKLPALRALCIRQLWADEQALASLLAQPWWPALTTLELPELGGESIQPLLAALPPRLERLDLSHAQSAHDALPALLAALPPTLRTLRLNAGTLQRDHLPALLGALDRLPALDELDLSGCYGLRDTDAIALARHPSVAKLHRLKLHHFSFKSNVKQAIAASPRLHLEAKTRVLQ